MVFYKTFKNASNIIGIEKLTGKSVNVRMRSSQIHLPQLNGVLEYQSQQALNLWLIRTKHAVNFSQP